MVSVKSNISKSSEVGIPSLPPEIEKIVKEYVGEVAGDLDKFKEESGLIFSQLENMSETVNETHEATKALNDKIKELDHDKISFITVSGTFVAIFTFISVEIQILRYICDFYKIIGFTLVFAGTLLLFILLLDYVARSWLSSSSRKSSNIVVVFIISSLLLVLGLCVVGWSHQTWKCIEDTDSTTNIFNDPTIKLF